MSAWGKANKINDEFIVSLRSLASFSPTREKNKNSEREKAES